MKDIVERMDRYLGEGVKDVVVTDASYRLRRPIKTAKVLVKAGKKVSNKDKIRAL